MLKGRLLHTLLLGLWLAALTPAMGDTIPLRPDAGKGQEADRPHADFHRGMSYTHSWRGAGGYGTEISAQTLARLKSLNVDSIALMPFGYMRSLDSTEVRMTHNRPGHETDAAMARDIARAHEMGIRVMLKPHIWIGHDAWCGHVTFENEEDWAAWFDSYSTMILHYARFAEEHDVDWLCIGNEMAGTTAAQPERWRRLAGQVREIYDGPIIYAATWQEYDRITWWDALDAIGINAYFPLSDKANPTDEDLRAGARRVRDKLNRFRTKFYRPVIFTEIGYMSVSGAAARPWDYSRREPFDPEIQQRCYEAMLDVFYDLPWFRGFYWWKWFSAAANDPDGHARDPYSPRNKPAEGTLARWYGRAPAPRSPQAH